MASESVSSQAMMGGDGQYSYARNSEFQSHGVETAKAIINRVISDKLDLNRVASSSSKVFSIADLGCSDGPNTFNAVQNIIDSVKLKCQSYGHDKLEFQVFFNDLVSNDFNALYKSLPSDRQYYAAGVPGSFHNRLFPKASINFFHCSYGLQWLSSTPKELNDQNSPAYNKGRIYYSRGPNEVVEAYSAESAKGIESFLLARAQELASGGLMALIVPCLPDGISPGECSVLASADLLGDCLMDMAKMGLLSEAQVDSFNLPSYFPTPQELKALLKRNASFSVEKFEPLALSAQRQLATNTPTVVSHLRTNLEMLVKEHFGNGIIEDLFDRFSKKIDESSVYSQTSVYEPLVENVIILKHNALGR